MNELRNDTPRVRRTSGVSLRNSWMGSVYSETSRVGFCFYHILGINFYRYLKAPLQKELLFFMILTEDYFLFICLQIDKCGFFEIILEQWTCNLRNLYFVLRPKFPEVNLLKQGVVFFLALIKDLKPDCLILKSPKSSC